jgi:hypothetical protein
LGALVVTFQVDGLGEKNAAAEENKEVERQRIRLICFLRHALADYWWQQQLVFVLVLILEKLPYLRDNRDRACSQSATKHAAVLAISTISMLSVITSQHESLKPQPQPQPQ